MKQTKGPGRPATGQTTRVVSVRLRAEDYRLLEQRAERVEITPTSYVQWLIIKELKRHQGQGTRARIAREKQRS